MSVVEGEEEVEDCEVEGEGDEDREDYCLEVESVVGSRGCWESGKYFGEVEEAALGHCEVAVG